VKIRPLLKYEEPAVRALSATIYDGSLQRPEGFHLEHRTVVADDGGAIAGYATYAIVSDLMLLIETAVVPAYRGRGLSRKLMQARLDIAKAKHLTVIGAVRDGNDPMIHLLHSCGFEPYGRTNTEVLYRLEP
jgi:GNAT superfamily N-acetyltransferase